MEARRRSSQQICVSSVKDEDKPDIFEIRSSSDNSSSGPAAEITQEISSDHVRKRPRLQTTDGNGNADSNRAPPTTGSDKFGDGFGDFNVHKIGKSFGDADWIGKSDVKVEGNDLVAKGDLVEVAVSTEKDSDLPDDFLEPLDSPLASSPPPTLQPSAQDRQLSRGMIKAMFRQFWKAGDEYDAAADEEGVDADVDLASGVDHIRVHPKFLHSNATSHKWALGAIAELLDNALDEAVNGATFVNVDMVRNPRNGHPMLTIEDDGGGMDPERIRQCVSLGFSAKNKVANMIGQYGNGFKTSTMRLGADVLVFSRSKGKDGSLPTQSIGLLSYTFLMATGQDDIVVPMLDYEVQPFGLKKIVRGTLHDWNQNLEALLQWSPYDTEQGLLREMQRIKDQGTIIVVFNLWENEEGELELDFDADPDDIQLGGTNRNERNKQMALKYPHCQHFFTYKYSLRSYASILYLRLPKKFQITLRGKPVIHHRVVKDLMLVEQVKYKPLKALVLSYKDAMTVVTLGFVKHAREHLDVQGFNVYHKNRLIIPFWRVWNYPGSDGRCIFGVLEANFVEPAHDKQGFERTTVFARLETRLVEIQKSYWAKHCREIGYRTLTSKKKVASKAGFDATKRNSRVVAHVENMVEHTADMTRAPSEFVLNDVKLITDEKAAEVDLTASNTVKGLECLKQTLSGDNEGKGVSSLDLLPGMSSANSPLPLDTSGLSLQASLMSESLQDSSEALISPSSQSDMPEYAQCTSKNVINMACPQVRSRTLTRSMVQLQQSHAKVMRLEGTEQQRLHEPMTSSTTNMSCLSKTTVEDGARSVTTLAAPPVDNTLSDENMDKMKDKLDVMRQKLRNLQADLSKVCRERDFLKGELEEERKRQFLVEDELQKRLKTLNSKATELEAANALMQVTQM